MEKTKENEILFGGSERNKKRRESGKARIVDLEDIERERERGEAHARTWHAAWCFFPLRNRYAVRTSRIETKEAKGRKSGREGGRKRKAQGEWGASLTRKLKTVWRMRRREGSKRSERTARRERSCVPWRTIPDVDVLSPCLVLEKPSESSPASSSASGSSLGETTKRVSSNHSACCVASCCLFLVVCFLTLCVHARLPNRNTKMSERLPWKQFLPTCAKHFEISLARLRSSCKSLKEIWKCL